MTPRPQRLPRHDDKLYSFFGRHTSPGAEATWFPLASVGVDPKAKPKGSWFLRAFDQGKIRVLSGGDDTDGGSDYGLCVQKISPSYEPFLIFVGNLQHFMAGGGSIHLVLKSCVSSCPEHVICPSADCYRAEQSM